MSTSAQQEAHAVQQQSPFSSLPRSMCARTCLQLPDSQDTRLQMARIGTSRAKLTSRRGGSNFKGRVRQPQAVMSGTEGRAVQLHPTHNQPTQGQATVESMQQPPPPQQQRQ